MNPVLRSTLIANLFLFSCAASAFSQNWQQGRSIPGGMNSSNWLNDAIPPEQRTHDFGTVARAAKTEHRFFLTNPTDKPLHLRSVRASCGCTTPIIETEWIQPGEQGSILAVFNTGTFTGQRKATLTVSIDQPVFTEIQLQVRGYIRSDIVFNPGEVVFGQVAEGEGKTVELTLDYAGRNDWEVTGITSTLPFVDAQLEQVSRESGRIRYRVTATLNDDAPAGFIKNHLILRTNDRRLTSVPLVLTADVQPAIQFSPQDFALGSVTPGSSTQQRLVVKGRKPFRILDISSEDAEIEFEPTEDAKPAHLVNITVRPKAAVHGPIDSHIILKTDLIEEPLRLGLSYVVTPEEHAVATEQ